jgi:hypothetical protein
MIKKHIVQTRTGQAHFRQVYSLSDIPVNSYVQKSGTGQNVTDFINSIDFEPGYFVEYVFYSGFGNWIAFLRTL